MKFQISCLLFIRDLSNRLLLIRRRRAPNFDTWSPPGGKLEMELGESPFECAKREAFEEVALTLQDKDLNLFGYVSEKAYEGNSHWLMFMFDCLIPLKRKPKEIDEDIFNFLIEMKLMNSKFPLVIIN